MLPSKMPIYCATTPVDLRRSFDGLAAATREVLSKDPHSGALLLFVNKAGDRLKALERGVFRFPAAVRPGDASVAIDATELGKILKGLDVARRKDAVPGIVHKKRPAESAAPTL